MKKKFVIVIVAVFALLSLSACGKKEATVEDKVESQAEETASGETKEKIKITELVPGMTRQMLERIIGEPYTVTEYPARTVCYYDMSVGGVDGYLRVGYTDSTYTGTIEPYVLKESNSDGKTQTIGVSWTSAKIAEYDDENKIKDLEKKMEEYLEKELGDEYTRLYEVSTGHRSDFGDKEIKAYTVDIISFCE